MQTAKMSFRVYRTFLLNIAAREGDKTLADVVMKMTTKELRKWYDLGIVQYHDMK